jgi:small subunit ribosomal protein S1
VLDIDQEGRRLSLGVKQTEPNPWDLIEQNYHIGDRIKGSVRNLTDFGAFVEVAEGVDGLVHISDLTWNKRIKHPSEVLQKGDEVDAVILKIDSEAQRLSLGIKQLVPDAWDEYFERHRPGQVVTGKIVRLTDFGAFVELMDGVEGLIHVSELAAERVDKPSDRVEAGQEVKVKILRMDPTEKKIALSMRAALEEAASEELADYQDRSASAGVASVTLGDVAGDLARLKASATEDRSAAGGETEDDGEGEESQESTSVQGEETSSDES